MPVESLHQIFSIDEGERVGGAAENIQPPTARQVLQRQEHHFHLQTHIVPGWVILNFCFV